MKINTKDGLYVILELAFQYRLIRDELPALYAMNMLEYEQTFSKISIDAIRKAVGDYKAPDYWVSTT